MDHCDWSVRSDFYPCCSGGRSLWICPKDSRTRISSANGHGLHPWCGCGCDYLRRNAVVFDHLRPVILETSLDHRISGHRVVWSGVLLFQGLSEASEGTTPLGYTESNFFFATIRV